MSDADLEVHDVECLRPHYAKTLSHWSANFERHLDEAVAASSERTARIWRLYLAGCAHAFEQRWISIYQVLASRQTKPGRADAAAHPGLDVPRPSASRLRARAPRSSYDDDVPRGWCGR